jgi:hypothetical protein
LRYIASRSACFRPSKAAALGLGEVAANPLWRGLASRRCCDSPCPTPHSRLATSLPRRVDAPTCGRTACNVVSAVASVRPSISMS